MTLIQLTSTEAVPGKPFTDLRYTTQDIQAIRYIVTIVWQLLEAYQGSTGESVPLLIYHPQKRAWTNRIVVTQPERLFAGKFLTVVGFFGIKSSSADVKLAQKLDQQLLPELCSFDDLLAYATVWLPTGNFGNLVLFASPEGKEQWGKSKKHSEAVGLLTPNYYTVIRLYNGRLPDGIASPDTLCLDLIKYYDYSEIPLWRAVRKLDHRVTP